MRLTPFFACFILSIITSSVIGVPVPSASTEGGVGRRLQEETVHEDIHRAVGRGFSHGDGEAKVTTWTQPRPSAHQRSDYYRSPFQMSFRHKSSGHSPIHPFIDDN